MKRSPKLPRLARASRGSPEFLARTHLRSGTLVAAAVTLMAIAVTAFASRLDRRETAQANRPARFQA
ncbi:hypothetical protein [Burkholderia contaminans]|uniref:hypothetical protein n=1 Tax=Burkholderia contaminans TaxID=488447 RepID=UPI0008F52C15|nr:hypothetical protein [Burkholderia contaminans]